MIKIYNDASIPYKIVGKVIDKYIENGIEDTLYAGKVDIVGFIYKMKEYEAHIKYTERYVEYRIVEIGDII